MTTMSGKTEYAVTADGCILNAAGAIIGHAGDESDGKDIAAELNFVAAERDEIKDKLAEAERERDGWREASRKNADLSVDNEESLNKILIEFGNAHSIRLIVQGKAAAEAREAKLRAALENIDWHVRREMPIGAFANVASEALAATVTGIPVTPSGITDTMRLDWLNKHAWNFYVDKSRASWRSAIDAVMRQEGGSR